MNDVPRPRRGTHLLAGSVGGLLASASLQPFDVLKTRIQQSHSGLSIPQILRGTLGDPPRIRNLWRGTVPSIVRSTVGSGLYFFTLSELRHLFPSDLSYNNLLTGASARAAVGFVMMPVTILKVRYESDLYAYKSLQGAVKSIYAQHGTRGFFYGFGATAIRDAPYAGIYVTVYESLKRRISVGTGKLETLTASFGAGLGAGFTATLVTNPFDVMRTRMQLQPGVYPNFWRTGMIMFRKDGVRSFLDGVALRIARKSISSAFTWSLYEFVIASL